MVVLDFSCVNHRTIFLRRIFQNKMKGFGNVEYWTCQCGTNNAAGFRTCPVCGKAKTGGGAGRSKSAVAQRSGRQTLDVSAPAAAGMVANYPPLFVRITQFCPREIDADNISGGLKQLQDTIAESLGRPGDSTKEGFQWQCRWKNSEETLLLIEIFEERI
jgi:hypothetical protein